MKNTLSVFRAFHVVLFILIFFCACAGRKEYKRSVHLLNAFDYKTAIDQINIAIAKNPDNTKYKYQKRMACNTYIRHVSLQCDNINIHNLQAKIACQQKLIGLYKELCQVDNGYTGSVEYHKKLVTSLEAEYDNMVKLADEAVTDLQTGKYGSFVEKAERLEPYKPYIPEAHQPFDVHMDDIEPMLDDIEEKVRAKKFAGLSRRIGWLEKNYSSMGRVKEYREEVSQFYSNKVTAFSRSGFYGLAFLYDVLKNEYAATVEMASLNEAEVKQEINIPVYISVSGIGESETETMHANTVFDTIMVDFGDSFAKAGSAEMSDFSLYIHIERSENNIAASQPQRMYSKFVSGYHKRRNSVYYEAKECVEREQAVLDDCHDQALDWRNAFIMAVTTVIQSNCEDTMNSPEAYDLIPIIIDYTYSQKDININWRIKAVSHIIDHVTGWTSDKVICDLDEDTNVTVLSSVHPNDDNGLRNSEAFDYNENHKKWETFVQDAIIGLAGEVSKKMDKALQKRATLYSDKGQLAMAGECFARNYLMKKDWSRNKVSEKELASIFPKGMEICMEEMEPPEVSFQEIMAFERSNNEEAAPASRKADKRPEGRDKNNVEERIQKIPTLIEASKEKGVTITAVRSIGI